MKYSSMKHLMALVVFSVLTRSSCSFAAPFAFLSQSSDGRILLAEPSFQHSTSLPDLSLSSLLEGLQKLHVNDPQKLAILQTQGNEAWQKNFSETLQKATQNKQQLSLEIDGEGNLQIKTSAASSKELTKKHPREILGKVADFLGDQRNATLVSLANSCRDTNSYVKEYWKEVAQSLRISKGSIQRILINLLPKTSEVDTNPLQNTSLHTLDLSYRKVTEEDLHFIADHFPGIKHLKLQNSQITDRDLAQLARMSELQTLDLGRNQITDAGLTPLTSLTQLQELGLSINQITNAGLAHLALLNQLQILHLGANQITTVAPLVSLTQLQELDLSVNQIIDIAPLASLTQLQRLYVSANQITNIAPLASITQLQRLYLVENQITDVTPLAPLTQLQELDLRDNLITDVASLASINHLQRLDLARNHVTDAGLAHLALLTQLQELNLRNNPITDAALNDLARALQMRTQMAGDHYLRR
jgi:Leucine-rich repeat (LRR) protein